MVEQIFLSPQVKQSVIISNKDGIYELTHGLPNDLRIWILENLKISISKLYRLLSGVFSSPKMKILSLIEKIS